MVPLTEAGERDGLIPQPLFPFAATILDEPPTLWCQVQSGQRLEMGRRWGRTLWGISGSNLLILPKSEDKRVRRGVFCLPQAQENSSVSSTSNLSMVYKENCILDPRAADQIRHFFIACCLLDYTLMPHHPVWCLTEWCRAVNKTQLIIVKHQYYKLI